MIAVLLSTLLLGTALADPPELPMAKEPLGRGLGIAVGDSTGVAWAIRPDTTTTFAGVVGWSLTQEQLHLHADYHHNYAQITIDPRDDIVLRLSVGGGLSLDLGKPDLMVGIRVPLDFTLIPGARPFDVFLEVAPVLFLVPDTEVGLQASTGLRFFFR